MNLTCTLVCLTVLAIPTHAQTSDEARPYNPDQTNGQSRNIEARESGKPDVPKPKVQDTPNASKNDAGYVWYETKNRWPDPGAATPHSWNAFRRPWFSASAAMVIGLTAAQLIRTDSCINAHKPVCNIFWGKNRAGNYGVNITVTAAVVWGAARLKVRKKTAYSAFVLVAGATYQNTMMYSANP